MLRTMMILTVGVALTFVTAVASPQIVEAADCSQTQCSGTISQLYTNADNSKVLIKLAGSVSPSCTLDAGYFTLLSVGTPAATPQATFNLLLAAYLAGKTVRVRYVQNSNGCNISYVTSPS